MLPSTDGLPCLDTIEGDGINNLERMVETWHVQSTKHRLLATLSEGKQGILN